MFILLELKNWYHLFGIETHSNRAITTQSWDYLVYLRNLAMHKDHLPYHKMKSQSPYYYDVFLKHQKCWHDNISGPCASLLILMPELLWTSRDCPFKATIINRAGEY